MLGAEPDPKRRSLVADAVSPAGIRSLQLEGVPAFGERHALRVGLKEEQRRRKA
jgi:hypothetical protein